MYLGQIEFAKRYFPDYPTLATGDRADFIIWDYAPPTPLHSGNFFGHYIYGALEYPVRSVVQQGEFLMKDFILTSQNEGLAKREIYKQGERLYKLFSE